MPDESDRIEQIRSRRRREEIGGAPSDVQQQQMRRVRTRPTRVGKVGAARPETGKVMGIDTASPWLRDRVTLSLEAQIAMIEMRANYRLTLADMGYHNRLKIISIKPGVFLKVEPTGCYKMAYHNRI